MDSKDVIMLDHLPDEMLLKILEFAIGDSESLFQDIPNIMSVCKKWRQLIKSALPLRPKINRYRRMKDKPKFKNLFKSMMEKDKDILKDVLSLGVSQIPGEKVNLPYTIMDLLLMRRPTSLFLDTTEWNDQELWSIMRSCKNLKHIDLYIDVGMDDELTKPFIDLIVENSAELHHLDITISSKLSFNLLVQSLTCNNYPKLQSLSLCQYQEIFDGDDYVLHPTEDGFYEYEALEIPEDPKLILDIGELNESMPNLRSLNLECIDMRKKSASESTGFNHLRELSLFECTSELEDNLADMFIYLSHGTPFLKLLSLTRVSVPLRAILEIPSRELSDLSLSGIFRRNLAHYSEVVGRFANTLESLSLTNIECFETSKACLELLTCKEGKTKLKRLELQDVSIKPINLLKFIQSASDSLEEVVIYGRDSAVQGYQYTSMTRLKRELLEVIAKDENGVGQLHHVDKVNYI